MQLPHHTRGWACRRHDGLLTDDTSIGELRRLVIAFKNNPSAMKKMIRAFPEDIWIVSVAAFFNRSAGFLAMFAAIFFTDLGLSPQGIVSALLVVGVAGVLGSIVGGHLSKPIGEMRVLVLSTLLNIPVLLLLATFAGETWSIGLAAVSVALSQAFMGPSAALIANSSYKGDRVTLFAFFRIFVNVGSVVAPAVAIYLGQHAFQKLFYISAAVSLVTSGGLFFTNRHLSKRNGKTETPEEKAAISPTLFTRHETIGLPRIVLLLLVMALTTAIYTQHQSTLPIHLYQEEGGMRLFSQLLILNPTVIILCEFPLSFISRKFRWPISLGFGIATMGVGLSISGIASPVVVVFFGYFMFTIGEALFAPMASSALASLVPRDQVSKYQGYLAAVQALGLALGPAAGTSIFFWQPSMFWWILMAASVLAGGTVFVLGISRKDQLTRTPKAAPAMQVMETELTVKPSMRT